MVGLTDVGSVVTSISDGLEQEVSSVRENENLGVDLLEGLDSYLEDINDWLTISRMVKAVERVAEEKIAAKELEVASLKERLHFHKLGADKSVSSGSPMAHREERSLENGLDCSFPDAVVEHDKMRESLCGLRSVAVDQIKKLKKDIDSIRGCGSMRKIGSGSELVGLGGILPMEASKSLVGVGVDKRLTTLKTTVDTVCTQADDMVRLAKASLCEWQQEQEFQREFETMVIWSSIRSIHKEFEDKLWDQNAHLCGSQSVNWLERINEVSNLRKELDVILKSLSNAETGQLISHGSHDMDHFHRKALSNHVLPSTSILDGNGKLEESKNGMPENWDAAQLNHMSKDEMVNYFNSMITKMRRNHESKVQELTEVYFGLKQEYIKIKEKGFSLPLRKDKDLDISRKKIPEVILKLDDILVENEKIATLSNNVESLGNLKDRLNGLLSENRQLKELLAYKRKEVKCLSSQVSDASDRMLHHASIEANLLKLISNLKSDAKDAEIEALVSEEVYKCVLRDVTAQINCDTEELALQSIAMQEVYEIIYREASQDAKATSKCEIGDSDIESLVMQGLCGVFFKEAIKDAQSQINDLNRKYLHQNEILVSLELKALKNEEESRLMIEEKDGLKEEVLSLEASLKEKDKLALELSAALDEERVRSELASQESNNLKDQAILLQTLFSERSKELDLTKGELEEVLEQIDVDEAEMNKLNQKLELKTNELREADEQRNWLMAVIQEERVRFELGSHESNNLKDQASLLQTLVSERSKELDLTKGELEEVLEQIDVDKAEINKLNQKLELKTNELREADEQRNRLMTVIQEMQNAILLLGAKENEQSKQMQAVIVLVHGLSKAFSDFERQAAEGIKKNNLRLEESSSQLSSLIQKTNKLKRTEVLYKKKCADLQLAESEMNHQQNGAYYINLMNDGADYEFVDEPLHQGDQASPISPQIETIEKSQRGRNFTTEEDSMIISAWLNISLDPVQGNEQQSKAYWLRVWEYFHQFKTFSSSHSQTSLMNRWSAIQLATNRFNGCFAQIQRLNQSGKTEKEKIDDAKKLYKELYKSSFLFEHCWHELRDQPKWREEYSMKKQKTKKVATPGVCSPCTPGTINLEDNDASHNDNVDLERPPGRKTENERLNKRKNKDRGNEGGSPILILLKDLKEDRKKMNDKKIEMYERSYLQEQEKIDNEKKRTQTEQEKVDNEKEKMRMEQLKKEERIMSIDTSGLPPLQAKYVHCRQMEILQKKI